MLSHARAGEGAPLLLAHGIGMSHRAFDRVIEPLARDFDVYAVDLPGFGDSPALDEPPTMRALARACADFMRDQGHERFHAAGNSLGGGISLHLALEGRALSACGLSPVGFATDWERAYLELSLWFAKSAGGALGTLVRGPGRLGVVRRELLIQYLEHAERMSPDDLADGLGDLQKARAFWSTTRHAINWRAPADPSLPCPVTIAWGEHDRLLLTGPQAARARREWPEAHHVTLHDCGHLPAWDDPDQVVEVIRSTAGA
jgi:pimeloyl-ACP methyl ester carboxylesterase